MLRILIAVLVLWLTPTVAFAPVVISGAAATYPAAGGYLLRFNGGAGGNTMHDLLPGAGAGTVPADVPLTIFNHDPTGLLEIRAGVGSQLQGGFDCGFVLLGPKQAATFVSDGTDYFVTSKPDRTRVRPLPTYVDTGLDMLGQPRSVVALPLFYVNPDPLVGNDCNSGIDAAHPFLKLQTGFDFVINNVHGNNQGLTIKAAHGTYTDGLVVSFPYFGFNTNGIPFFTLDGDILNNTAVHIAPTPPGPGQPGKSPDAILVSSQAYLYIRGVKLSAPNPAGSGLKTVFWGFATTWEQVGFGSAGQSQVKAETFGYINLHHPYAIYGGTAANQITASGGAQVLRNASYNVVLGNTTYTDATVSVSTYGLVGWTSPSISSPPSVTVTGIKAKADGGTVAGVTNIPGSAPAWAPTNGGQIY